MVPQLRIEILWIIFDFCITVLSSPMTIIAKHDATTANISLADIVQASNIFM